MKIENFKKYLFAYMRVYECRSAHVMHMHGGHRTMPEESVLSFHHVGPRNQIQILSLGGRHFLTTKPSLQPENKQTNSKNFVY